MSFFSELKRRNVIRVALLYAVASWLILQVADVGISLLGLPDWTGRFVFLLLVIGFPLVVVFSWAYELTPEGLKREKDVERDSSITHETARKLNTAVIVLLVIAVGGLIADRLVPERAPAVVRDTPEAAAPDKSIAVLPFVNMSADPENEYFSDGLSEELLNLLAKIPDLQVAARTSAFSFKGSDADIAEIAGRLNVAHVLEGSVRKSGDDIRVTAQLIKATDGYHLWSETWDRKLVDVFAIQDEIAEAVVDQLKISLLGETPHARVTDPRVFELYLQAKAASDLRTPEGYERSVQLLMQALAIDPDYVDAWVELSATQTNQAGAGFVPKDEGYASAKASAERALRLDATNARAMATLGWVAMYGEWDFDTANRLIRRAADLDPNDPSVLNALAVFSGNLGDRESMTALYEEALIRDPVSMSVLSNLAAAYLPTDRLDRSAELVERMREVSPDSAAVEIFQAWVFQFGGQSELALEIFDRLDPVAGGWGRAIALYDLGRDEESLAALEHAAAHGADPVHIAVVHAYRNEPELAFEWLNRGLEDRVDSMVEVRLYWAFASIAGDPRWETVLRDIGISDADARRLGI